MGTHIQPHRKTSKTKMLSQPQQSAPMTSVFLSRRLTECRGNLCHRLVLPLRRCRQLPPQREPPNSAVVLRYQREMTPLRLRLLMPGRPFRQVNHIPLPLHMTLEISLPGSPLQIWFPMP